MTATDTLDNTTAVPTRKRAVDQLTFFSSHQECYERGIHAKTPQGREMCRTGQGFSGRQAKTQLPTTIKSTISSVTHAATIGSQGPEPVCATKIPAASVSLGYDDSSPVNCKKCQKLSA